MWFSVTGLPVSRPWKIGFLRCVIAVMRRDRLLRGRRVIAGIFAERAFHHGLVHVDFELDHDLGRSPAPRCRRSCNVVSSTGAPRKPPATLPVVGVVRHLHLAGIGEDRIDADHQRGLRRVTPSCWRLARFLPKR